jgi:hypothetical protein
VPDWSGTPQNKKNARIQRVSKQPCLATGKSELHVSGFDATNVTDPPMWVGPSLPENSALPGTKFPHNPRKLPFFSWQPFPNTGTI